MLPFQSSTAVVGVPVSVARSWYEPSVGEGKPSVPTVESIVEKKMSSVVSR